MGGGVMTATVTGTPMPTVPREPGFGDGRRIAAQRLQQALDQRWVRQGGAASGPRPVVAALGAADVRTTVADEVAQAATVWLAARGVIVAPGLAGRTVRGLPGCGRCLQTRWQRLRPEAERAALELAEVRQMLGPWPLVTDFVADPVWALHRQMSDSRATVDSPDTLAVSNLNLQTLQIRRYLLTPDALCPVCGAFGGDRGDVGAFDLGSVPKTGPDDYRTRQPHEYEFDADTLANPVCGLIGPRLEISVSWPTTAPVSGQYQVRVPDGLADVNWSGQADSFEASRSLAFLEGLERYAGNEWRGRGGVTVKALDEIADEALDPRTCGMYPDSVYQTSTVFTRFDPARPIPWMPGHRLSDGARIMVPSRLAYYGPDLDSPAFVQETSSGCATGGTLAEAVLFGLLELVERDAFLIGWYHGVHLPELDLSTCSSARLRMMIERASWLGYEIRAFDNRVDLPIPVVTGVAVRKDGGPGLLSFAAGAALDPEAAILAAVSEILTYIPVLQQRYHTRRDEILAMAEDYDNVRRLPDHPALFTLPAMRHQASAYLARSETISVPDAYRDWNERRQRNTDLVADVAFVEHELARLGHAPIVVEHTTPEQEALGLCSVRTVAPGMIPIDFGWYRQRALEMPRMFTAPVRAGWSDRERIRTDLHLVPHPFP